MTTQIIFLSLSFALTGMSQGRRILKTKRIDDFSFGESLGLLNRM